MDGESDETGPRKHTAGKKIASAWRTIRQIRQKPHGAGLAFSEDTILRWIQAKTPELVFSVEHDLQNMNIFQGISDFPGGTN